MALAQEIMESYSQLDLRPGATVDQAKAAYHRLAKVLHPDLNPDSMGIMMARVNQAYRKVMAHLESQAATARRQSPAPSWREYDLEDFGRQQASRRPAAEPRPASRPQTQRRPAEEPVPFISVGQAQAQAVRPPDAWRLLDCQENDGRIFYRILVQGQPQRLDLPVPNHRPCPLCQGSGQYSALGQTNRCPACGGRGQITSPEMLAVELPPSVSHGQTMWLTAPSGRKVRLELLRPTAGGEA